MLNVQDIIEKRYPTFFKRSRLMTKPVMTVLKGLLHEKEMTRFNDAFPDSRGLAFVERVLDYFNFNVEAQDLMRIPKSGRFILIANHPIGALDALALLKMVSKVRPDVKVLGNHLLMSMPALQSVVLTYDKSSSIAVQQFNAVCEHLNDDGVLIVFPAGDVSYFGPRGVKDGRWQSVFLKVAEQANSPILPVCIDARNSFLFYSLSVFSKPLSTLLLLRETFKHSTKTVKIRVGELIDPLVYEDLSLPLKTKVKLFRKQIYRIGKNKPSLFRTLTPIALPEDRQLLKRELEACESLGETRDNKKIFLYHYQADSILIREIGRLREEAFRLIGEGTGNERDIDGYDQHYMHIVLWDEDDLEVVGAYRLCATHNQPHLYTSTLFEYNSGTQKILDAGLELGRSFIQPKYWGSRSLEYLWYGIAAFLLRNPHYRYLLGAVSISNTFSRPAKDLIVGYYQRYYADNNKLSVASKRPYTMDDNACQRINYLFHEKTTKEAFVILKAQLRHLGYSVPALYKQYADLTKPGGTRFLGFNIDPDFNDCVDGLVVVDIHEMSTLKRKRYGLMEHQAHH